MRLCCLLCSVWERLNKHLVWVEFCWKVPFLRKRREGRKLLSRVEQDRRRIERHNRISSSGEKLHVLCIISIWLQAQNISWVENQGEESLKRSIKAGQQLNLYNTGKFYCKQKHEIKVHNNRHKIEDHPKISIEEHEKRWEFHCEI